MKNLRHIATLTVLTALSQAATAQMAQPNCAALSSGSTRASVDSSRLKFEAVAVSDQQFDLMVSPNDACLASSVMLKGASAVSRAAYRTNSESCTATKAAQLTLNQQNFLNLSARTNTGVRQPDGSTLYTGRILLQSPSPHYDFTMSVNSNGWITKACIAEVLTETGQSVLWNGH